MKSQKTIRFVRMFLATCILSFLSLQLNAQPGNLKVIPEVQQFTATSGTYSLPSDVKISVKTADTQVKTDSLLAIANQLKDELTEMFGATPSVVETDASTATEGEILIGYSAASLKNKEAYKMTIGDGITLTASARAGAFWGTRTILQLVENHNNVVPCGEINDYPHFPSRGFMLDVGRKFFTIDFLRQYVKILSYYKMSEFHVHLNDNGFKSYYDNDWSKTYAAFRLESETYPGLAASDGHYTKEEFRNLQLLGMQYGVNVIPEIDIPAHSLAFTRYEPQLMAKAPYAMDHLELMDAAKRPFVYQFFEKLFDEYLDGDNPTFIGPDVHIGTDEYIKEGAARNVDNEQAKQFRLFTNHFLKYIADKGKVPRLWGGLKWLQDNPKTEVIPYGNAVMNSWSVDWVDPVPMLEKGFGIINTLDAWMYIVPAAGYYREFLDIQWLYNNFRPEKINGGTTLPNFQKGLLGSTFAVWNDICGNGISMQDVHYRAYPALKVLATKNWKAQPAKSYNDYSILANVTTEGAGINLIGKYSPEKLAEISSKVGETPIVLDGTTELPLGGTDLGYDYDVSFELKPASGNARDAVLFQSNFAKVTLNTSGRGRLGFERDGYVYTFSFVPQANKWQQIRIVGNYTSVTLHVNGDFVQRLEAYRKTTGLPKNMNFQQTLYFPLTKLGDTQNGYKGEIKNLSLAVYDPQKKKDEFLATKTTLRDGVYFIKVGNQYLNNTAAKGAAPTFGPKATNEDTQKFKITLEAETGRHKIVSASDESKYINELGVYGGANPYSVYWNTYNFYKKNNLYAIQNDGNSGNRFWKSDGTRFVQGDESYEDFNYIVEFISADGTGLHTQTALPIELVKTPAYVQVKGVNVKGLMLLSLNGSIVKSVQQTDTLSLAGVSKGIYLLNIQTKENQESTIKLEVGRR